MLKLDKQTGRLGLTPGRAACWITLLVVFVSSSIAHADIIDHDSLLLYSTTKQVLIDDDTLLAGAIAATTDIELGDDIETGAIYAGRDIEVGDTATVRGKVLANRNVEFGTDLDFQGDSITGDDVEIGDDATVTGNVQARDDINLTKNAFVTGNVLADDDIYLGDGTSVYGDASPGVNGQLSLGTNVTLTGTTDPLDKTFADFSIAGVPATPAKPKAGKNSVRGTAESVTHLDPGTYKDASFDRDSVLHLSAGEYTFKSFWMDKRGVVNVDTANGDVTINVRSGFDTGEYVQFNPSGNGQVIINIWGNDGAYLGKSNIMKANVFVWDGVFGAERDLVFYGTILAKNDITIAEGGVLYYSQGEGGYQSAVPEPATAIVILAGAGILLRRRRTSHT